eukprot:747359-Hanusia_phi.AAC.3
MIQLSRDDMSHSRFSRGTCPRQIPVVSAAASRFSPRPCASCASALRMAGNLRQQPLLDPH